MRAANANPLIAANRGFGNRAVSVKLNAAPDFVGYFSGSLLRS